MGYSFLRKAVAMKIDLSVSNIQFPHPNFLITEEETKKGLKKQNRGNRRLCRDEFITEIVSFIS